MVKVNVEGSPEAVAKFFREMGKESLEYPRIGQAPLEDFSAIEYKYVGGEINSPTNTIVPEEDLSKQKTSVTNVTIVNTKESSSEEVSHIEEKVHEAMKTGKKLGRPKKEKAVEPEVVTPDPEFSDLPDVAENATTEAPEIAEDPEKPSVTREMVQAALKEYGIWLDQGQNVPRGQIRPYLYALTKKFGNGVSGTPDLEEQYFEAVMQAAVSRVPVSELEEYL